MKNRFPILLLIALFTGLASCQKAIENQIEQSIIDQIITSGIWVVDRYQENTTDATAQFAGYEFKFNNNGTVTGTLNNNATQGTWSTDKVNVTITSNFPVNTAPLQKLNGVWKITDPGIAYVKANMNTPAFNAVLELRKK